MPEPTTPVTPAPATPATAQAQVPAAQEPATQAAATAPVDPLNQPSNLTNKQVNDLIVKDASKEVKKLLAEAGLETSGDIKADLAKLKTLRDSQLTEDQKRAERDKEVETKLTTAQKEASEARIEVLALRAGLPPPKVKGDENDRRLQRFVKLANGSEGATEAEKVAAVLKDFPEFVKAPGPAEFGGKIKGGQPDDEATMLAAMKKNAGIK